MAVSKKIYLNETSSADMKKCTKCKKEKELKEFYPAKFNRDGKSSWCKDCALVLVRENYLKRTHGITTEQYEHMLMLQNNGCAICGKEEDTFLPRYNRHKMLAVDHDHKTGRIRGLLCENCNRALGLFKDDEDLLLEAINYLNQFS